MARSEDYLDSLLDSLNESSNKKTNSDRNRKKKARSESQFLDEFEKELDFDYASEKEREFLKEFEKEIGYEDDEDSIFDSDLSDEDFLKELDSASKLSIDNDAQVDDTDEILSDIVSDIAETKDSDASAEADDDLMAGLANILEDAGEGNTAPADADSEVANEAPVEDDGIMSDIDGEEPAGSDDSTEDAGDAEPEDVLTDTPDTPSEATDEAGEGAAEGEENISADEVIDIGNLLDSIDEEGNIDLPGGGETVAVDENGNPIDQVEKSDNAEQEEEKVGFLKKLLGKLFKKKEKPEGEEEEAAPEPEPEESNIDEEVDPKAAKAAKKAAQKAEKEKKKKEKEAAKKEAAAKKAEAKKNKPPKEKKKKKPKEPDNSPKIPITIILLFVILAVSMIVLWNVMQNTMVYKLTLDAAQESFDKEDYMTCYRSLAGTELKGEEEAMLCNRAKLMATLQLRLDTYDLYNGKTEIKALDSLVRGTVFYNDHLSEAEEMGIPSEYDALGRKIVQNLSDKYGVSENEANTLMDINVKSDYTKELYRILEKQGLWSLDK